MNHTHIPSIVYVCLLSVGVYCKWHSMVINHQQEGEQSPYCECNHIRHEAGHPEEHKHPLKKYNYSEETVI